MELSILLFLASFAAYGTNSSFLHFSGQKWQVRTLVCPQFPTRNLEEILRPGSPAISMPQAVLLQRGLDRLKELVSSTDSSAGSESPTPSLSRPETPDFDGENDPLPRAINKLKRPFQLYMNNLPTNMKDLHWICPDCLYIAVGLCVDFGDETTGEVLFWFKDEETALKYELFLRDSVIIPLMNREVITVLHEFLEKSGVSRSEIHRRLFYTRKKRYE